MWGAGRARRAPPLRRSVDLVTDTSPGPACWWWPALTLAERAPAARSRASSPRDERPPATPDARVGRRLERWRCQPPFDRPGLFARRLRADHLAEGDLALLLDTSPRAPAEFAGPAPAWVAGVQRATGLAERLATAQPAESHVDPTGLAAARVFVEPFVVPAMSDLFAKAGAIRDTRPEAPFDPQEATRLFEPSLWSQLLTRAAKVVILELNVARVRGELAGATPELRFADFVRQLRETGLRQRILEEYPVLARLLVDAADNWVHAAAEFLGHLACDAPRLRHALTGGAELGTLTHVSAGAGDLHRQGRSVIIATFSSGARLVYKPRPLAADACFAALLEWVNARGQVPPLRGIRTLSIETHGWAEFVSAAPCTSAEEVARFYERFGAYLALLHALEATDFHYENVIASGEHPMLVDLEAVFHPRTARVERANDPEWLGWTALQQSVLRAGVLPFRSFASGESSGLDLSAVGGAGGQRTPNRHPVLAAAGTDEMHLRRDYGVLPDSRNRPTLGGRLADPRQYADRIRTGFGATYRLLLKHRDDLLAPGGPIDTFADVPIRIVLRPTHHYALILAESYHPDVLRDALERDRLLDRLWVAIPARPDLERVVQWEHADLAAGDVPMFTSTPSNRDVYTAGGERIAEFFEETGLEAALARIRTMSEDDLVRQQWIVNASLVGLTPGRHENAPVPAGVRAPRGHVSAPAPEACIDAARLVGHRLSSLALRRGDQVGWLGLTLVRERDWLIQPVGADLYGGTLGIAFFLAHLADVSGDTEHERLARAVVAQVMQRLSDVLEGRPAAASPAGSIGAFGALGGAVYALSHLAALWRDHSLLDVADAMAERAEREIEGDRQLDLIGGVAGLIAALAALDTARGGGPAPAVIRACADRLVATATEAGPGVAWTTVLRAWQPLVGFSHGASGMAHALFIAGATLGEARFRDTALAALRYERSTLDPTRENWPDFRVLDEPKSRPLAAPVMWAWCHGAPGIGLARLAATAHVDHAEVANDLVLALESTARNAFGTNDCLCHGDLGNLEPLIRAREVGYRGDWESTLETQAARLVSRLVRGEWRCGIPGAVETPGLMMGLAGIGYGLLRLGAADRVPSILTLEPTRRKPLRRSSQ